MSDISRAAALAEARYRYISFRNDLPTFRNRAKQFYCLTMMGMYRRQMLRLKVGDQRYHEMNMAYRKSRHA